MNKILIIQSDDRDQTIDGYHYYCSKINQLYCDIHKYDYQYILVKPTTRHPSWNKLQVCIDVIDNYGDIYDQFIYIDTDCIFKNFDIGIEDYFKTAKYVRQDADAHITFLNDKPWSDSLPCAGFFSFTSNNKEMFEDWWNIQLPEYDKVHPFEQKALYTKVNQYKINIIDDWMFQEHDNQFLRHIGSQEGYNRMPYFVNFYNKKLDDA